MADLNGLWGDDGQAKMADDARGEFTVLPPGWYTCTITKTELKKTNSGGSMLVVTMETDGTKLVDRFNIKNASDKAQLIGRQQLAKMAVEAGVPELTDSIQLHGMSVDAKVVIEEFKSNTTGNMLKSNKVAAYKKAGAASAPASTKPAGGSW